MTRVRVAPSWLAVREPADAAARAADLVDVLRDDLPPHGPLTIHDLACGTGATLRWLAPKLPGPQRWINHDLDTELLDASQAHPAPLAADGSLVTVASNHADVTRLTGADLGDAELITSSALLDLMCADELSGFVDTCAAVGCPVLLTLTVTGNVWLEPTHPLDATVAAAFNAHQRRSVDGRPLLGPDAVAATKRLFAARARKVVTRSSPWQLDASSHALLQQWLEGWLGAAREQDPGLSAAIDDYAEQRFADAADRRLRVVVEHRDLLVRAA